MHLHRTPWKRQAECRMVCTVEIQAFQRIRGHRAGSAARLAAVVPDVSIEERSNSGRARHSDDKTGHRRSVLPLLSHAGYR
jgi:hypothetical protein